MHLIQPFLSRVSLSCQSQEIYSLKRIWLINYCKPLPSIPLSDQGYSSSDSWHTSACSGNSRPCYRLIGWGCNELHSWNRLPSSWCIVLHRLPWKNGDLYGAVVESYADFPVRHYRHPTVVFWWLWWRTLHKGHHTSWTRENMHPVVSFTAERVFRQKGDFLSRDKNNALMIALFSTALTEDAMSVSRQGMQTLISWNVIIGPQYWFVRIDLLIFLLHYPQSRKWVHLYFR